MFGKGIKASSEGSETRVTSSPSMSSAGRPGVARRTSGSERAAAVPVTDSAAMGGGPGAGAGCGESSRLDEPGEAIIMPCEHITHNVVKADRCPAPRERVVHLLIECS